MEETLELIRIKIRKLDWMYDQHIITDSQYGNRLEYLLNRLEEVRK